MMDYTVLSIITCLAVLAIGIYMIVGHFRKGKVDFGVVATIAEHAVRYVEQVYKLESNEHKKRFAVDAVVQILRDMKINVNETTKRAIEIAIESAVNLLPETRKETTTN